MYWPPYVSVGERKEKSERIVKKIRKSGEKVSPVKIDRRYIANSFWGKSWCKNLESYQDLAYRLERGRSYVRCGAVVDLKIKKGKIKAMVNGSSLYRVEVKIKPIPKKKWTLIKNKCSTEIDSLIELLQGKLSKSVMDVVCKKGDGLFPNPSEIEMYCSCPDYAVMCKHVAAALFGVGNRLDDKPEHLFLLRDVDQTELIEKTDNLVADAQSEIEDIEGVFNIEVEKKTRNR